ncbi:CDP-diacylglycerol--serine O-phosphatidyltransferase [Dysgonomonas sp. PH5-45]|uniref:CDP-alcohol phosphatidyltransferase family protein n=1 Tax=unclassified Dysgonomonas TaxID=2630389 RepID=UPI002475B686|nr:MULTISPECIES: CDP-alcohol phosphatidyltransferase family protein [unclassified Dysgonomonas]MDH6353774.1 CDP-diacylglycerol--serine O-phosphatidyltransferase [Dysgonomonas sp. PH5-45]MDH6386677.1 CDP-diacylglycerol--serine O-phosphatidyltransferase [Dysgonomonas sp. PH5-37]
MKKHIPNLLTCLNLFSGCIACVMAFGGEYGLVVVFVLLGCVFDFFDGFAARLLKAPSAIGKELDSLADMVTSGMAPSLMVFRYLSDNITEASLLYPLHGYVPYFAFLLAVFSGIRLAKFNIDQRQTTSFIGLATPANALFWISFCYGLHTQVTGRYDWVLFLILALVMVFSLLLVSELPMFSLKIKSFGLKGNESRYLLILCLLISVILAPAWALAITILFYIVLAVTEYARMPHGGEQNQ